MLYDNALLAIAYLEAYQATKKKKYAEIAQQIFTYVLRDMTSPEEDSIVPKMQTPKGKKENFIFGQKKSMIYWETKTEKILQILQHNR